MLMIASSVLTFLDAIGRGNPNAGLLLIAYVVPVLIVVTYPVATLVFSSLEKWSPFILDAICLFGLVGFCVSVRLIFEAATTPEEFGNISSPLGGQVNFVLMLSTAFSFHPNYSLTFVRNVIFAIVTTVGIYFANAEFFSIVQLQFVQGFLSGTLVSWIFFETIRTRFYLKSTDADTRQHLYNQLSKLVYPHQLERIKLGDELENTMPLKEGKAIINVFDVQKSSEIRHERTAEFFMSLFQSFLQICMEGYEHNPLRSQAFRLKETGDGFISSVGYPFLPVDSRSLADSAVATALRMFEAFNREVARFNYSRPIKAAMGLAYNSVQGTFQSGGIRSYDLFGEALIQAAKYEELRKQAALWDIFSSYAHEQGMTAFNIMIVQEVVYNSLSPAYRDLFIEIDLSDHKLVDKDFQMMYDNEAKYIYFHLLP
jgi:class 3 adenylate cyclase